jgi:uncharacterized protein (TIGR03118 family)
MHVRRISVAACVAVALFMLSSPADAQYRVINIASNQLHQAHTIDPLLANPWGLARGAGSPWWISDNDTGWSTLYTADGTQIPLRVSIPTAGSGASSAAGLNGPGSPTGIVFNGTSSDFQVQGWSAPFLFATLDGTISGWAPGLNKNQSIITVDNSANKASYTGLAITSYPSGNFLYAADTNNNHVDMFDANFTWVKSFSDPSAPSNLAVFGVQDLNGLVYVTYAVPGVGAGGLVDIFTENGTFVKTLVQGTTLNQAWGVAAAPSNFGPLSNTLLVSNNSVAGTINGFDPATGKLIGTITGADGKPIVLNNLWGIAFGGGNETNGATNELFVTVGQGIGPNELAGTFAKIVYKP